ncbi:MAG: recombinase family protein, partial [Firmicutes bacterium]|nr:recombinase family protein [Bacillota bacterium]
KVETMTNRYTAPFGYTMEMGRMIVHPREGEIVRAMFADYLAGASLKDIAEDLTGRGVEYLPGESGWNKNRVKRILEDTRFLGAGQFPSLVDEATFHAVQARKQDRNDRKVIQPESHISQIAMPVVCAACGTAMTRTHHTKRKITEAWGCPCGTKIWLADSDLLVGIIEILNWLIADPALITEEPHEPDETQQLEIRRLQNEVGRQLEGFDLDREGVQRDIFLLAAAKFKSLPDHATAQILRAAFEKSAPLDTFSRELLEATTSQVLLGNNKVFFKLKNQQIIGKDGENADDSPLGEDSDADSCETGGPAAAGGPPPAEHGRLLPGEHQAGGTAPQL